MLKELQPVDQIDLSVLEVSPISELANYEDVVFHPKDGVGNSTLREGFKHLDEVLRADPTPEEYQKRFTRAEMNEGEVVQLKRRSFQWLAGKFEGASEQLDELGVEPYDDFNEFRKDPETQLQIINVLKRMSAGVVADWAFDNERKVKGESRNVPEDLKDIAYKAFTQLEDMEVGVLERIKDRTKEQQEQLEKAKKTADLARNIPLTVASGMVVTSLILAGCGGAGTPTTQPSKEEGKPKVTEPTQAPEVIQQPTQEAQEQNQEIFAQLIKKDDETFQGDVEKIVNEDNKNYEVSTFVIGVDTARFKFAQAKGTDENGNTTERLFLKSKGNITELDKTTQEIEGTDFVVWKYPEEDENGNTVPEPVIWYPALTQDQWQELTPDEMLMVFAPPTSLEDQISWFDRKENLGIRVHEFNLNVDQVIIPEAGAGEGTLPAIPTATSIPNIEATQTAEAQQAEQTKETQMAKEKEAQYEPGEITQNPEFKKEGIVIKEENMKIARNRFLDVLFKLNPKYFEAFNQEQEQNITDGSSLLEWLEDNNWAPLPLLKDGTGLRLMKLGLNELHVKRGDPLKVPLSLENPQVYFYTRAEFDKEIKNYNDPAIVKSTIFSPYASPWHGPIEGFTIREGITPIYYKDEHGQDLARIGFFIANYENEVEGYSISEDSVSDSDAKLMNLYFGFAIYLMGACKPPTEVNPSVGNGYFSHTNGLDKDGFVGGSGFGLGTFESFDLYMQLLDRDPDTLEVGPPPIPPVFQTGK